MSTKEDIMEKLNIIGLDLDNLPSFLEDSKPIVFNPSRLNNDKELKVYKYVSIKDIEIYCTTAYRDNQIKEKYDKSIAFGTYIKQAQDDDEKAVELMKVFDKISEAGIRRISLEQSKMEKKIPFTVSFNRNQLWQIYYSEYSGKYFMLFSLKEDTFDELFYLLKKKIELETSTRDEKVYVPISYVNYSEKYLTNKQINDIENYLWVFTKNWPLSYEVHDMDGNLTTQIVGETPIYETLKTMYKIVLRTKEEADEFYKLVKALFMIQTELGNRYNFSTRINNENSIEFCYNGKKIEYGDLPEFIKDKYITTEATIKQFNQEAFELEKKLKNLKEESKKKDAEYFMKQKEISTYLECKKTFFGKVRYFFSKKKPKISEEEKLAQIEEEKKDEKKESKPIQGFSDDKKYHTIDDLVTVQALYEKSERYVKDLRQDIKALELKIVNTERKIENATIYINEIDQHKKSLFEFWKFANKDELLELETGEEAYQSDSIKLKKKFDYDYDFEDFGINYDKLQRTKFSKQELDSIFISSTNVLPIINMLKSGEMNRDVIEEELRNLKSEYFTTQNSMFNKNEFDIFGAMKDDSTQVRYLNNKSHREHEKDKFQVLNVNKKIDIFDFTEKLQTIAGSLNEAMCKVKFDYDMPIYQVASVNEKLHKTDYGIFNINAERELQSYGNKFETAVKLFKLNFKEGFPAVFFTNSVYYDNINNTLPNGMDVTSKLLIDTELFEYDLVSKEKIITNRYFNTPEDIYPKILNVYIEEYDVKLKRTDIKKEMKKIAEKLPMKKKNKKTEQILEEKSLDESQKNEDETVEETEKKETTKKKVKKKNTANEEN
ncbi:MAG: hypothetical protein HFJ44_05675 [Clostridia bacterium]|nr:hypothetical protein [Clostridia bacterium]